MLLWIPTHGRAKAGRPARTYIQQLCEDTGCCPEDLPRAMNDREEWRERVRDIRTTSAIWWWWWWLLPTYTCFTSAWIISSELTTCLTKISLLQISGKKGSISNVRRRLYKGVLYGRISVRKPLLGKFFNVNRFSWTMEKDRIIEQ